MATLKKVAIFIEIYYGFIPILSFKNYFKKNLKFGIDNAKKIKYNLRENGILLILMGGNYEKEKIIKNYACNGLSSKFKQL